jgi:hypothetical protein
MRARPVTDVISSQYISRAKDSAWAIYSSSVQSMSTDEAELLSLSSLLSSRSSVDRR